MGLFVPIGLRLPLWATILFAASWLPLLEVLTLRVVAPFAKHLNLFGESNLVLGGLVKHAVFYHLTVNVRYLSGVLKNRLAQAGLSSKAQAGQWPELAELVAGSGKIEALEQYLTSYAPQFRLFSNWKKCIVWILPVFAPTGAAWFLVRAGGAIELAFSWVIAYHLLGIVGIAFVDSVNRKELLFEPHFLRSLRSTPSDGIGPLSEAVSTKEQQVYKQLGVRQPLVLSWPEIIWPGCHHLFMMGLVVISLYLWIRTFSTTEMAVMLTLALLITGQQIVRIFYWAKLVRLRLRRVGGIAG